MPPPQLPALPPGPLSLGRARQLGLTDHQWRLAALQRTTQGVRCVDEPSDTRARAAAFALALPADAAFSHVTAAQLWGLPLPAALERQVELDVIRPSNRNRVVRRGCRGHRGAEARSSATLHGVRLTGLADTWVDLGEVMGRGITLDDLVIAGDVVTTRSAGSSGDPAHALRAALARRVRPRNAVALCAALQLVRAGVRSPMETRARLMFHRAGFPEPEVNGALHAHGGGWLAEGDLVWRAQRVVGEYQGDVHAGIRNRSRDAHRKGLLEDEGWRVLEIFSEDLNDSSRRVQTLARFGAALRLDPGSLTIA